MPLVPTAPGEMVRPRPVYQGGNVAVGSTRVWHEMRRAWCLCLPSVQVAWVMPCEFLRCCRHYCEPSGDHARAHLDRQVFMPSLHEQCRRRADGAAMPGVAELDGHTAAVTCLAFSSDGTRLVSGEQHPSAVHALCSPNLIFLTLRSICCLLSSGHSAQRVSL